MTKGNQLSNRDLERLSAYLDGALSEKEASRLEARLREEPTLQQALQELKKTAQMLASLSEISLPRSFTLTPEMVGIRDRPRIYPVMRLATALATFAFFAVVGIDAITNFALNGALAPASKKQVAMEAPAPAADTLATGATPVEGLDLEEYRIEQEEVAASEIAAEAENEMDRAAPSGVLGLTEETQPLVPQEGKTEAPELPGTPTSVASGTAGGELAVDAVEAEPELTPTIEIQPTYTPMPTSTSIPLRGTVQPEQRSILRVAEFGLGGVALLLAGLTLWIARKD